MLMAVHQSRGTVFPYKLDWALAQPSFVILVYHTLCVMYTSGRSGLIPSFPIVAMFPGVSLLWEDTVKNSWRFPAVCFSFVLLPVAWKTVTVFCSKVIFTFDLLHNIDIRWHTQKRQEAGLVCLLVCATERRFYLPNRRPYGLMAFCQNLD